ncbi:MAG TPA: hypothetical protein VJB89_02900 [Candidatus Nanoarchaeia archaeon]|nr:hypothetical protein [Candidatus Nanoarchaeia archaeon]
MNKRGDFDLGSRTITSIFKVLFVLVFILYLGIIIYQYRTQEMNLYPLETEILTAQLLHQCITDENIINLDKFNQETIQNCINKKGMGFKLTLTDLDRNLIKNQINLMPEYLNSLYPICDIVKHKTCLVKNQLVSFKDKDQINPGILKIEVIFENV